MDPKLRILVVDDKMENRYLLESMLGASGYETVSASNGIDALEILKGQKVDAIIADLLMPKMDGFQLIRECKKDPLLKDIPFIIYTATYTDTKDIEFGMSLGAARYIIKPAEADDLLRELNETLRLYSAGTLPESRPFPRENEITERQYSRRLVAKLDKKILDLEKSEALFRKVFLNSPMGIALVKPDFRFFSVNPAWISMTGYTEAELLQMSFKDLTHPDHLSSDMEHMKELVNGSIAVYSTEKRYIRKDNSILWGFARVVPIRNSEGSISCFIAQVEDITLRKQAEEQKEALIKELGRKNAELDRFASTVSHDLKNPLLSIRGFLQILEGDLESNDIAEAMKDVSKMQTSVALLEMIITTLLELSRCGRSPNAPVQVPFSEIAREAAGLLEAQYRAAGITLVIPDTLPVVTGDRQRLIQVMTNLLDNAAKYMGDQKAPKVEVGARTEGDTVVFFVRDNGSGLMPEDTERIFDLFFRVSYQVPGSGIGLATVKRIIEAHGGKIRAESEGEGKGTTFLFTLPMPLSESS